MMLIVYSAIFICYTFFVSAAYFFRTKIEFCQSVFENCFLADVRYRLWEICAKGKAHRHRNFP